MLKKFEDQSRIEEEQHKQRVFVVHGRNEELRKSMFDFLRSVGLKPIEWSQAIQMTGETAPFVGDILNAAFLHAQAVVVLLTGDDEARLRPEYHTEKMPDYEKNLTPQSRPNVLFEAGLAMGRFPKQTIVVEIGDLRPFSDIAGRHTIRLNNSTKTRQDLAQRLSLAGCQVDLTGTDWHQSGNFDTVKSNLRSNKDTKSINGELREDVSHVNNDLNLDQDKIRILELLSKDTKGIQSFSSISSFAKLNIHRLRLLMSQLIADGYVTKTYESSTNETYDKYQLTQKAISYLLNSKKI